MPKTLNPQNTFPTSITNFPISGNNEPIAIEPLEAAIQAVLDRTENLHQSRVTLEGIGTKRIRQFASRSALSAASGFADGDIVSVDGYGLYRLFTSSGASADGIWVLTASGGGRWIHIENDLKGANLGLATLNSDGRLAQDVRDASIATVHIANGAITSTKLAPGAVVGHLGYTPLNKAGDNMTGSLRVQAKTFLDASSSDNPTISCAIGDYDTGLNWGGDGVVKAYANGNEVFGWNGLEVIFYTNKKVIIQGSLILPVK
jgi:hypothetical protein